MRKRLTRETILWLFEHDVIGRLCARRALVSVNYGNFLWISEMWMWNAHLKMLIGSPHFTLSSDLSKEMRNILKLMHGALWSLNVNFAPQNAQFYLI